MGQLSYQGQNNGRRFHSTGSLKFIVLSLVVALSDFLSVKRKGFRKPRLSEPTVATLKLTVQQSPVRIIRPSPTPISPSYKAKANTKVGIMTCGTLSCMGPGKMRPGPIPFQ